MVEIAAVAAGARVLIAKATDVVEMAKDAEVVEAAEVVAAAVVAAAAVRVSSPFFLRFQRHTKATSV